MRSGPDLEVIMLKAETNRLEIETYLALSQLETHEAAMQGLVQDLKTRVTRNGN